MITEDEARETRCCGPEGCGTPLKNQHNAKYDRYCIASECMAWRWDIAGNEERQELHEDQQGTITGDENTGVNYGPEPIQQGFCGLAGKP